MRITSLLNSAADVRELLIARADALRDSLTHVSTPGAPVDVERLREIVTDIQAILDDQDAADRRFVENVREAGYEIIDTPAEPTQFEEWDCDDPRNRTIGTAYSDGLQDDGDCPCQSPNPGFYICTRPAGHDGPHVAHTAPRVAAAWWPR